MHALLGDLLRGRSRSRGRRRRRRKEGEKKEERKKERKETKKKKEERRRKGRRRGRERRRIRRDLLRERKREMAGVVVRPLWCRFDLGFRRGVIRTTTTGWRQIALFHSLALHGSSVRGRRTNFVGGRKGRYSPGYRCSSKFNCFVFLLWFCKGAAVRECRSEEL